MTYIEMGRRKRLFSIVLHCHSLRICAFIAVISIHCMSVSCSLSHSHTISKHYSNAHLTSPYYNRKQKKKACSRPLPGCDTQRSVCDQADCSSYARPITNAGPGVPSREFCFAFYLFILIIWTTWWLSGRALLFEWRLFEGLRWRLMNTWQNLRLEKEKWYV